MPALLLCQPQGRKPGKGQHKISSDEHLAAHRPHYRPYTAGCADRRGGILLRLGQPDRLRSARTAIADRVELHQSSLDAQQVMRMRQLDSIALPAGQELPMRLDQSLHLMLVKLKRPLKVGERFDLTLTFERAGTHTVTAWVQQPRERAAAEHKH